MWFKVDDKLHDHRKARKAGKAAMGVWVLAGSWAMDNESEGGFIPDDILARWGSATDARRLVDAGLWREATHKGEHGWKFHDWARFQPSAAVTAANRAAKSEAGLRGNHRRWHADRGITDPDCEYCFHIAEPSQPATPLRSQPESDPNRPVPGPDPEEQEADASREDVDRICTHLADRIESHGVTRPTVGKTWHTAARLMVERDGFTEEQIHWLIDKAHDDDFWRSNILSLPKLREKGTQLRIKFGAQARPSTEGADDWMRRRL